MTVRDPIRIDPADADLAYAALTQARARLVFHGLTPDQYDEARFLDTEVGEMLVLLHDPNAATFKRAAALAESLSIHPAHPGAPVPPAARLTERARRVYGRASARERYWVDGTRRRFAYSADGQIPDARIPDATG